MEWSCTEGSWRGTGLAGNPSQLKCQSVALLPSLVGGLMEWVPEPPTSCHPYLALQAQRHQAEMYPMQMGC